MPGQLSLFGSQVTGNKIAGVLPFVGSSAPVTIIPGQTWIDTGNSNAIKRYNGSAWVTDNGTRYIALLYAAPNTTDNLNNLYEINTAGYTRQVVPWNLATATYPSEVTNSALMTFGPMTADMTRVATHAALVDSPSSTTGNFYFWWELDAPQQVAASQSIQISVNTLTLSLA